MFKWLAEMFIEPLNYDTLSDKLMPAYKKCYLLGFEAAERNLPKLSRWEEIERDIRARKEPELGKS